MNREDYQNLGYQILPIQVSMEDVQRLQDVLNSWRTGGETLNPYGILHNNIYKELPLFYSILEKYNLGKVACELLDCPEIILFQDNLIWKPSGTERRVQWHQDFSYWPLSAGHGATFWVALDDIRQETGALSYIPRSEQWGECRAMNFTNDGISEGQDHLVPLPWEQHEHEQVVMEIKAGQVLAHHPFLAHMSYPNISQDHRRAWSLTWITPDVAWDTEHAPHPYPLFHSVQNGARVEGNDFPRFKR